jgi:hypothetical protein
MSERSPFQRQLKELAEAAREMIRLTEAEKSEFRADAGADLYMAVEDMAIRCQEMIDTDISTVPPESDTSH